MSRKQVASEGRHRTTTLVVRALEHPLVIAVAMAWLVSGGLCPAAEVTLTENGKARSVIVVADAPSPAAKAAAAILRDHLRAMSGAELEIASASAIQGGHQGQMLVLVGTSPLVSKLGLSAEGLGPGGICIHTSSGALALFGPDGETPSDPWGTLYAVTTFLEDHLGCRYLWPGESGKVIPKRPTITVGDIHVRYTPKIRQRHIRSLGYSDRLQVGLDRLGFTEEDFLRLHKEAMAVALADPGWFRWHHIGGTMNLRSGHAFGHYWAKYGKDHPDWFAMQPSGSRDQSLAGNRARLCTSNPGLIEQIARDKIVELSADPARTSVSLAPNDGGRLTFCMCDRCKALDPPEGRKIHLLYDDATGKQIERRYFDYVSLTDRMVAFYNAIAERVTKVHPQGLLVADAYSVYSAPPVKRKLHPNIVVRFVPMTYLNDEGRKKALSDWDAWSRAASKIYFRPNFLNGGRRVGTLLVFAHKMGGDLRYLSRHGMVGTDFDSCLHNWATHGLNHYVLAKLLWNPDGDVDALIDEYCRSGFGPAAAPIKRYFARVEQITDGIARQTDSADARRLDITEPYTPQVIAELSELLKQAEKLAAGDKAVLGRIAFLRQGLAFTDVQARAYRFLEQPASADRTSAQRLLDRKYWLMREIFEKDYLAVNVAYVAWGGGGYWKRLGWRWEADHRKPEVGP